MADRGRGPSEPGRGADRSQDRRRGVPVVVSLTGRRRDAFEAEGVDATALRRARRQGAVVRLGHGLYGGVPYGADGEELDARLAALQTLQALTADDVHAASHGTAAALLGLPLPELLGLPADPDSSRALARADPSPRPPFHLTRTDGGKALRRTGLVLGHRARVPEDQLTLRHGIRLTTPARVWADVAAELSMEELVMLADALLRIPRLALEGTDRPFTTPELLAEALAARGRGRGTATARRALQLARVGADSPRETQLRLALRRAGLPEMEVNAPILDGAGRVVHEPDLMVRRWKVSIEYEGEHHSDPRQVQIDVARSERVEALGWAEARITARHAVDDWAPAVEKVERTLCRQGWRP